MSRAASSEPRVSSVVGVMLFGLMLGLGSATAPRTAHASALPDRAEPQPKGAEPRPKGAESKSPETGELRVGDTLEATRDVSLDEAVLVAGSRVSVSAKHAASGAVVVDVALADGHVVRGVPLGEIQKNFRRVRD